MHNLESYLFISAMLFCLGVFGVMTRRNAIAVLMGVELILNAGSSPSEADASEGLPYLITLNWPNYFWMLRLH